MIFHLGIIVFPEPHFSAYPPPASLIAPRGRRLSLGYKSRVFSQPGLSTSCSPHNVFALRLSSTLFIHIRTPSFIKMALKFKPYDPVQHQRQAKQRQQKRSAGRSTVPPISTTSIGSLPLQSLVAGHKGSWVDDELLLLTNTDKTQDPYYGYPSPEECLELCSAKDTTVSSAYTPTSGNPLSYTGQDNSYS